MKTLISIVGTTGIGKTRLAIDLARYFNTEIISCDSRQFFKELKIGTATPSVEELAMVSHHFIGNLSITDSYSIGQFEIDALQRLDELFSKYDIVIMVGGSMMYEKAIIEGLNNLPEANEVHQEKLETLWKEQGMEALLHLLKKLDPEYYDKVDKENPRRLLRAIDVIWQTKRKYSEIVAEPRAERIFRTIRIGIEASREIIYDRINTRVDKMIESGLLEEVKALVPYRNFVSLQTVGYTELFKYFDGIWDFEYAISEIKKNSRRFAKRQLTWYRKENEILWVNFENPLQESLSLLKEKFNLK